MRPSFRQKLQYRFDNLMSRGTPAMQACPTVAIDLPIRMLVWQDEKGATWLAYNEPGWLFRRHGLPDDGTSDVMMLRLRAAARSIRS